MIKTFKDYFVRIGEALKGSMRMKYLDQYTFKGHVELFATFKDGTTQVLVDDPNVIVTRGRSNMAHLWGGLDTSNRIVTYARFSDGGHNPESPTEAIPPAGTETAMPGNTVITKAVSVDLPDGDSGTKVRFTCTVGELEGNGSGSQAISAVGMLDTGNHLVSLKTFGLISKSEAFSITLRYTFVM